jgi:hypothetical protein
MTVLAVAWDSTDRTAAQLTGAAARIARIS